MSRRSKQRRKRKQAEAARAPSRASAHGELLTLGGAAAAVAAAPLAGVPSLPVELSQPVVASIPVVAAQSVPDDSGAMGEPPRLDMTVPLGARADEFSSMELEFFQRAEQLYHQMPVESFEDLEPSKVS